MNAFLIMTDNITSRDTDLQINHPLSIHDFETWTRAT